LKSNNSGPVGALRAEWRRSKWLKTWRSMSL
jgi:hypothetical protein